MITWITRPASVPLLENNRFVQEVIPYGPDALVQLAARKFDRVINLDAGKISAGLAAIARADKKVGYISDERGFVTPTNPSAADWLRMGIFDDLKKKNVRTYQEVMCSIVSLPVEETAYVLELTAHERQVARNHLAHLGVDFRKPLIGIHTGGGERWRLKQWHPARFRALAQDLHSRLKDDVQIVLFGGPSEVGVNRDISNSLKGSVFDAGCDNTVRHFAALLAHCAVALSGDTLAMHVALAVGCRVVVLFGPTSHAEIELFGRGEKVVPNMSCLVCYKQQCDFSPNCMDLISVGMVKDALLRQLKVATQSQLMTTLVAA
jgi:heptosyltransferase-2